MGYRSDVRIIVSKEGYKELCDYVREQALEYKKTNTDCYTLDYDYNLLNTCDGIWEDNDGDQVMLGWNYIKWYSPVYKDVKIIEDGLDYLDDKGFSWRFSRIGESYDDIEERYNDGELDQDLDYPVIDRCFNDEYYNFKVKVGGNNE